MCGSRGNRVGMKVDPRENSCLLEVHSYSTCKFTLKASDHPPAKTIIPRNPPHTHTPDPRIAIHSFTKFLYI